MLVLVIPGDKSLRLNICRILETLRGHIMTKRTVIYRDIWVNDRAVSAERDHTTCLVSQVLPGMSTKGLR